jgi:hypothetical protein
MMKGFLSWLRREGGSPADVEGQGGEDAGVKGCITEAAKRDACECPHVAAGCSQASEERVPQAVQNERMHLGHLQSFGVLLLIALLVFFSLE